MHPVCKLQLPGRRTWSVRTRGVCHQKTHTHTHHCMSDCQQTTVDACFTLMFVHHPNETIWMRINYFLYRLKILCFQSPVCRCSIKSFKYFCQKKSYKWDLTGASYSKRGDFLVFCFLWQNKCLDFLSIGVTEDNVTNWGTSGH